MLNKQINSKSSDEILFWWKHKVSLQVCCFFWLFVLCVDSYSNNAHMTVMGHFLQICYINYKKNCKCHREAAWKLCLRSLFRSWNNDYISRDTRYISRDTRLPLQNGTYAATVSLFTSDAGNAHFWKSCFSISLVFWDLSLSSAFSNYFFCNWDTQYFLSFRAATALRGKLPSLHCFHTCCWLYFTCKRGSAMPSRCAPCV